MIGQTLAGRYHIIDLMGGGMFGQTYLAEDLQRPNHDHCVVKHLHPQSTDPFTLQEAKRLFEAEAQVLNRLGNHDQIPRLLAHFEENQEFYLVQDIIAGQPLSQEVKPGKRLSQEQVIKLLQGILEILEFVHEQNVIHRDIKPSNIIRRQSDKKLVLIDFGAVKQITTQVVTPQGQSNFTIAVGTEGYMPSEQTQGKPRLASDIYAVGMIAIQALTGIAPQDLPEDGKTGEIIWRERLKINPKLAKVIDTMVRCHFSRRYQSATEALKAVKRLQSSGKFRWILKLLRIDLGLVVAMGSFLAAVVVIPEFRQFFRMDERLAQVADTLVYENEGLGIQMNYPKTWEQKGTGDPFSGTVALFVPKGNNSTGFKPELTISVEPLTESMSLADYTTASVAEIIEFLPEAKIFSSESARLAGDKAHRVIYTGKDEENNVRLKSMQVWVLKKNQAYIVTYTAAEDEYQDGLKPVEEVMMKSFKVR
ncbi:MAG: protein kinase [Coleofasciculus sp. D1-CHI-01]|uniref:protein kinase domain-containing protein n=1 Tax=Coleofasciculus sp. D1-CHI-01 TaxID=3068482 RepID=UPI0032FF3BAA